MNNTNSNNSSGGIGVFGMVFIVFLVLKLAEIGTVATWSWWWVTAPLWMPIVVVIAIILIACFFALVVCGINALLGKKLPKSKRRIK